VPPPTYYDPIPFPAKAVASALPLTIDFGVVAAVLIFLTRGRLDYGRLAEAQSPSRVEVK
jgi:hypothetical protein